MMQPADKAQVGKLRHREANDLPSEGETGTQKGRAGVRQHTETHYSLFTKSLRRSSVLSGPNAFLIYFLIAFLSLAPKP